MVERLEAGQQGEIVLDLTPFYGEQGGQVGDTGVIETTSARVRGRDTKVPERRLSRTSGGSRRASLVVGEEVLAKIDVLRRERIRRNHTATHLLHWALRLVLGEHAKQAGSHVAPDRLRFDFTHFEAMTREQLLKVERLVNAKIFENHPVRAYETSIASAKEVGVTALFGEKYGDFVRVLEVGNFSKELCGGTHIGRTSEIGFLKILSESSVGANLRRIEAVTSFDAYEYVAREESELLEAADAFKVPRFDVSERALATVKALKEASAGADAWSTPWPTTRSIACSARSQDVGYRLVVVRAGPDLQAAGAAHRLGRPARTWRRCAGSGRRGRRDRQADPDRRRFGRGGRRRDSTPAPSSRRWLRRSADGAAARPRWRRAAARTPARSTPRSRSPATPSASGRSRRAMRILGLDIGETRIGVAVSDPSGSWRRRSRSSTPARRSATGASSAASSRTTRSSCWSPGCRSRSTVSEGPQAARVRAAAARLAALHCAPARVHDERLSSAEARRSMTAAGVSDRDKRGSVDMVAAAIFLQSYLDARRGADAESDR